jgi:hypothetical protein
VVEEQGGGPGNSEGILQEQLIQAAAVEVEVEVHVIQEQLEVQE